jgi:hypothetical protein
MLMSCVRNLAGEIAQEFQRLQVRPLSISLNQFQTSMLAMAFEVL